jgi:hypothetical protein
MQSQLIAGDTFRPAAITLAAYPAGVWTLHFRLTPRAAGAAITFDAAAAGTDHQVSVLAATTAGWAPGAYHCGAWVTNGAGDRFSINSESGPVQIMPDPVSVATGTDQRSQAEIALANVSAFINGTATGGVARYKINGREIERYALSDLLKLQQQLRTEVDAERAAAGLAPRYGSGIRRIMVRTP